MNKDLTADERTEVRDALRKAAFHKAEMWDSLRALEGILETEVESDNAILDSLAADVGCPAELWPACDDETLDQFLEDLTQVPQP